MKTVCPDSGEPKAHLENKKLAAPFLTRELSVQWEKVISSVHRWMLQQQLISMRMTIVLPFVQLIAPARQAWGQVVGAGIIPRFETTQTWAARLGGVYRSGAGPSGDTVTDYLQARDWLKKMDDSQQALAGVNPLSTSSLAQALVNPLVDMANELVGAAGALPPAKREMYWQKAAELTQQIPGGVANIEAALGPLAVAWARATEGWSSDILFQQTEMASRDQQFLQGMLPLEGDHIQRKSGLVVIQAGGKDALTESLYEQWPEHLRLWIDLDDLSFLQTLESAHELAAVSDPLVAISRLNPPAWDMADDGEDEAQRAAAQVITLLNQGHAPVALCTQDRPVARRVWAILNRQQIAMADETGWTLSTTRAAAMVMNIARSGMWGASTDMVLDALKALPVQSEFTTGLDEFEAGLRQLESHSWPNRAADFWSNEVKAMFTRASHLIELLRYSGERSLWAHLQAFNRALKYSTAVIALQRDEAGREVLQTLHCYDLDIFNLMDGGTSLSSFAQQAQAIQMDYAEFVSWIAHALESMTFIPPAPEQPQVIFTPLARVMLRSFAAVVIPGCDDSRLTRPPKLSGFWREQDRIALGLMSRSRWWQRLQAQWVQALRMQNVSLLWRKADGSEPLGPASLVRRVIAMDVAVHFGENSAAKPEKEKRQRYFMEAKPTIMPAPVPGPRLPLGALSASAYQKLRNCPYQFYAEQLLALREKNELDDELDKRDYGNWVHQVLSEFHQRRAQSGVFPTPKDDVRLLDECASRCAQQYDEAAFIPWAARWPITAQNYLKWLFNYEVLGIQFERAETAMQYLLTPEIVLQGRIDRIDRKNGIPFLIDYKTERLERTKNRVRDDFEDVQLPFYVLLAQGNIVAGQDKGQTLANAGQASAFYLSLDDRESLPHEVALENIDVSKQALQEGIVHDIERLAQGHAAYPLGDSHVCQFCAVKGLCRKAFWDQSKEPPVLDMMLQNDQQVKGGGNG